MQLAPPAVDTRNPAPLQTPKILEFLVRESGNYVLSGLGYPGSITKTDNVGSAQQWTSQLPQRVFGRSLSFQKASEGGASEHDGSV